MRKMKKEKIITTDKPELFAAANSGKGFTSFYGEIFNSDSIKRRYLIKGGPGTGKSTFMRRVAVAAEGKGDLVEYYRCSSDPSSLDGIIINKTVAIIDSTAPHSEEAELVGAKDSLIDLGAFWNTDRLRERVDEIERFSKAKKDSYARAYRFLGAAMQSDLAARDIIYPYIDQKRLKALAKRLFGRALSDGEYLCKTGILRAIGMSGKSYLDSYEKNSFQKVYITEHYGIGSLLLSEICALARENKNHIRVSYDPLNAELPDGVYIENAGLVFLLSEDRRENEKNVSLRRILPFSRIDKREKKKVCARYRNAKRISCSLIDAATQELEIAGKMHFALENIYKESMDFAALERFTDKFIDKTV